MTATSRRRLTARSLRKRLHDGPGADGVQRSVFEPPECLEDRTDRWTEANPTGTKYPADLRLVRREVPFRPSNPTSNAVVDGIYIYKISYVRIKNITLSYSLPRKVVNRVDSMP